MDFENNYCNEIEFKTSGLIKPNKCVGNIFSYAFVLLMKNLIAVFGQSSFIQ
jgi:hypothetical protein